MKMIRIEDEQYKQLEVIALDDERSITSLLRSIIKEYLSNDGYTAPTPRIEPQKQPPRYTIGADFAVQSKPFTGEPYIDPTTGEQVYEQMDIVEEANKRTISAILTEITDTKSKMKEETDYCQDPETKAEITKKYNSIIQGLWDEYNEVKNER